MIAIEASMSTCFVLYLNYGFTWIENFFHYGRKAHTESCFACFWETVGKMAKLDVWKYQARQNLYNTLFLECLFGTDSLKIHMRNTYYYDFNGVYGGLLDNWTASMRRLRGFSFLLNDRISYI